VLPFSVSVPAPPFSVSPEAPPSSVSFPASPNSVSAPLSPETLSFPFPPLNRPLAAFEPTRRSPNAEPMMLSTAESVSSTTPPA
jgi:hypothetical protein